MFFICRLTETELKYELLEKDPYALDVPNTAFGRGSFFNPLFKKKIYLYIYLYIVHTIYISVNLILLFVNILDFGGRVLI